MSIQALFPDADLERIRAATARAESSTEGEIVAYLVERVDDHDQARWRGATLGAIAVPLVAAVIEHLIGSWAIRTLLWITVPAFLGAALGYLLTAIPVIGRLLMRSAEVDERVLRRAEAAFLEEGMFNTARRTGILLFIAVHEHRALVLADEGINRQVPDGAWQGLIDDLVAGIRRGAPADAVCDAISRCGAILDEYGVRAEPGTGDELRNGLRVKER